MVEPDAIAWGCALGGLLLGALVVWIPGVPGSAIGLLGLVAFAGLTDFTVVPGSALVVATLCVVAGTVGQLTGPVSAGRALGGSAGAATGAAMGAALGSFIPLPLVSWVLAVIGALTVGLVASRRELVGWVRGVLGTATGCVVAVTADAVALLGVGAVLATCDALAVHARWLQQLATIGAVVDGL